MQGYDTLCRGFLGQTANAAQMPGVAQSYQRYSVLPGLGHPQLDYFVTDNLPKSHISIDDGDPSNTGYRRDVPVDRQPSGEQLFDVSGDSNDAVRIVTDEVRVHQSCSYRRRFFLVASGSAKYRLHSSAEHFRFDFHPKAMAAMPSETPLSPF